MKPISTVFAALLVAAGASAWFVISTVTLDVFPDAAIMAGALLVTLAFVSAFAGTPLREKITSARRSDLMLASMGGALSWLAAPLLVFSQRSTDAPSGSETLFLTTSAWGLLCVLAAFADRSKRPLWSQAAGALLALLGSAALLANWERPSSFSPFIKFPLREALFLVAGVLFAAGSLMVVQAAKRLGLRTALWLAVAMAAVAALVVLPFSGIGAVSTWMRLWPQILLLGAALGSLATGWTGLAVGFGLARPSALLFSVPLAVSALAALERALGVYGPNPIVWLGASAGAALLLAGAALTWGPAPLAAGAAGNDHGLEPTPVTSRPPSFGASRIDLGRAAFALAAVATLLGAVTLALPAFSAEVEAVLGSGRIFQVSWTMLGFESAAGWLALLGGLLALAGASDIRAGGRPGAALWTALTGIVALAAYPLMVATPLHTWNPWIPAEVQQSYGTEYAHLSMNPTPDGLRYAALALSLLSCVVLAAYAVSALRLPHKIDAETEEPA